MALYDDAKFIFLASAAAGVEIKDSSKAPCVKPVEQLTGSEKVINGDFDSDSDWTKGTGWSISGGTASCSGDQTGNTGLSQLLSSDRLEDGSTYKITYTISNYVAGQVNPHLRGTATGNTTGNGTRSVYGVAGSNDSYDINFFADSNFNASIDNVSIKKVTTKAADFDISRDANLDATRVGPTGLIEKGRENLILQSNTLGTGWTPNNLSVTSGAAGYDGSSNAFELKATSGTLMSLQQTISDFTGVATFSVFAKSGPSDKAKFLRISLGEDDESSAAANSRAYFNLTDDATQTIGASAILAKIEAVGGDGWKRCSLTVNVPANHTVDSIKLFIADSLSSQDADVGDIIFLQDFQYEVGLVATDVITTTSAAATAGIKEDEPRFDYPLAGGAPSLLLEPERTNLITVSEYFGGSSWTDSSSGVTVVNNDAVSPEGVENAAKLVIDNTISSGAEFRVDTSLNPSVTNGKSYAFSVFAKAAEFNQIQLDVSNAKFGANCHVTATLTGDGSITAGSDVTSSSIENYGNGWYRITMVGTVTGSTGATALIFRLQVDGINGTGDGSKGIHVYGAQFEEGASATSYIPTHGTADTRSADNVAALDTSGFSFGTTCTIFYEGVINKATSLFVRPITMFGSVVSNNDRFLLFAHTFSSGTYKLEAQHKTDSSGSQESESITKFGLTVGAKVKCAAVISGTSFKFFVNGALATDNTSNSGGTATITADSIFQSLDLSNALADQNHAVGSVILWDSALTDQQCIDLTTL